MRSMIHQKRHNIRQLAKGRNPLAIPALKQIAMDKREHLKVRKEAIAAIGGFGGCAVKPLTDILVECPDNEVKKAAGHLLHAFDKKEIKQGWTNDMKESLALSVGMAAILLEGIMR